MNKLLLVFKIMVLEELGLLSIKKKIRDRDFSFGEIVAAIFIILLVVVVIRYLGPVYYNIFLAFFRLEVADLFLTMVVLLLALMMLFTGLYNMISGFYGGDFSKHLVTFPLHAYQLFGAYMLKELIFRCVSVVLFLLPVLIFYSLHVGGTGPGFWLVGLLVIFFLPVIPTVISALLGTFMRRFINISRYKKPLQILGSIAGLAIFVLWQLYYDRLLSDVFVFETIEQLIQRQELLIRSIGYSFPPALWAVRALTSEGIMSWGWLTIFLGSSLLLLGVNLWAAEKLYFGGLLGGETAVKKESQEIEKSELARKFSCKRNPVLSIFNKEWLDFIKTPSLIKESLWTLIFPLIIVLSMIVDGDGSVFSLMEEMGQPGNRTQLFIVYGIWGLVVSVFSDIPISTFSREGKNIWLSIIVPVEMGRQIRGKQLFNLSLFVVLSIPIFILFLVITEISILLLLVAVLFSLVVSVCPANLFILVDLLKPNFEWETPEQITGLFKVFAVYGLGLLTLGFYFLLFVIFSEFYSQQLAMVIIFLAAIILGLFSDYLCRKFAGDLYKRI